MNIVRCLITVSNASSRRLRIFERLWISNARKINNIADISSLNFFQPPFKFMNSRHSFWRAKWKLCPHKFPNFCPHVTYANHNMLNEQENERKAKQSQFVSATSVADLISRTIKHANHRCNLCTRKRIAITTLNRSCCECINSTCITQLCPRIT